MDYMQQQPLTQMKLGWQDVFFWHAAFHKVFGMVNSGIVFFIKICWFCM